MISRKSELAVIGILLVPLGYALLSSTLGVVGLAFVIAGCFFLFLLPFSLIRDFASPQRKS